MPRNSSGVYSLPESPFIPGTTIESAPVNSNFDDIADAITGSVATDGSSSMTGPFEAANGTIAAPSITFTNSTGTGWYRVSNNVIAYVVAGVVAYTVDANRILDMEVGLRVGNAAVVDTAVLDWYEEGTFVPVLNFNGGTTGITYGTEDGTFTRIGDYVFFNLVIVLTSKGSSTGTAFISGLPYDPDEAAIANLAIVSGFGADVGETSVYARVDPALGFGDIRLEAVVAGAGGSLALDDTDFTNVSALRITGAYKTVA